VQTIGGAAETEFFGNGDELSQLTQLDHVLFRRPLLSLAAGYRIEPGNTTKFEGKRRDGQAGSAKKEAFLAPAAFTVMAESSRG
jgi:hypothetical protein